MKIKGPGFSLLELVVAIAIGGVILATVMGSYLTLAKTKQNLDISRQIQREINFAAMRVGDRIRAHSVNYAKFDESNHHFLPLGDDEFVYSQEDKTLTMNGAPLFSPSLEVSKLNFDVTPLSPNSDAQERVQIELLVTSKVRPTISVPLRTTISSRIIR